MVKGVLWGVYILATGIAATGAGALAAAVAGGSVLVHVVFSVLVVLVAGWIAPAVISLTLHLLRRSRPAAPRPRRHVGVRR
ncbi:hypothetical protein BLA24_19450 [Streptomyces cinnamoneus]|uniref:Uncharacterized protein n=1 Tax=Streptomyces cinnamoneus TaxID=53446 RepID=A0A2G1XF15_STRCJ|nr:hypothetical protein [Streptomyces cinnamoneus]PHQ49823.1 hypothetical protein BLA24_19450 [Streptomyces cinnamoneus]PPT13402.1 hypothetical protein CYQ11_11350 [Streptomyces cinnamoneus]